jgi:hypothetical protein
MYRNTLLRARLDLVNIRLPRALVDGRKVRVDLPLLGKPRGHAAEFFTKAVDSLHIHVGLRNELGH